MICLVVSFSYINVNFFLTFVNFLIIYSVYKGKIREGAKKWKEILLGRE